LPISLIRKTHVDFPIAADAASGGEWQVPDLRFFDPERPSQSG